MSFLIRIIIVSALLFASCQKPADNRLDPIRGSFSGVPAPNEVWMQGMAFVPSTITVSAGTSVKFINKDSNEHTVTADDNSYDSGVLGTNKSYTKVFKSGVFNYHCTIHPEMKGTVIAN